MACVPNLTPLDINQVYKENVTRGYGSVVDDCGTTYNKVGLHTWNGVLNVKDFGAAGDGVTDDYAAIAAAIAALPTPGGGAIFFPSGTYLVGTTIVPNSETLFFGTGKYSSRIITLALGAPNKLFYVNHKNRVSFRDLGLVVSGSASQTCIEYFVSDECNVTNCNFQSLFAQHGFGIYIRCDTGGYNNTFIGCDFEGFDKGVILGNVTDGGGVNGVCANQNFFGCKFTTNLIGVWLQWCNQILFAGCRWEINTGYGLLCEAGSLGISGVCVLNGCFESNLTRHFQYTALVSNSSFINCNFNLGTGDIGPDTSNFFIGMVAVPAGVASGYFVSGNGNYFRETDGELGLNRIKWNVSHAAGAVTCTLGAVAPVSVTTPYKWVDVIASDGTPCVMPIWKV